MTTASRFRTAKQVEAFNRAISVGYEHSRDSEYRLRVGRGGVTKVGVMIVLFGKPTGLPRAMIIYPDGSVVTQERKRGGSEAVTFNTSKLSAAIATHGTVGLVRHGRIVQEMTPPLSYTDEDEQHA